MPLSIAIIGSGPAGFYTVDALLKAGGDIQIDIIERLPTPYGLIRSGVSPDHESTKNVTRSFERTARAEGVRYFGNVEVGRDVSIDDLRAIYDAVVLAVGGPLDRSMEIPGVDKHGVYGAAAFVGWYNGHPDFHDLNPDLGIGAAAVIGNGNVAIDVARMLMRTKAELAETDTADHAAAAIQASALKDVCVLGRRGPLEAKFTNVELREVATLEGCVPLVDAVQLPDDVDGGDDGAGDLDDKERRLREKNLATLRDFAAHKANQKPRRLRFGFYAAPVEILGGDRVEGLRLERTRVEKGRAVGTGKFIEIPCGLIVTAIGYRATPLVGAPFDEKRAVFANDDGRVADGLYVVGWAMHAPVGVISSNRADGKTVAAHILADCTEAGGKPGRAAFLALLDKTRVRAVDFAEWQKIEAAEVANATSPAPRRKFVTVDDMLAVLDGAGSKRSTA